MEAKSLNGFRLDDLHLAVERVGSSWPDFQNANIFITGATGFLGQWVLAVLIQADRERGLNLKISVLTRSPKKFAAKNPELAGSQIVALLHGDVRSFEFPKGTFTHLIHAATDTSMAADNNPLVLLDSIVEGTKRVLKFAHMAGIQKVLFTSSGAIYGPQPADVEQISEEYGGACSTTDRRSVYGQGKRLAEQMMTIYSREFGIETKIARCFAFAGPGMALDAHFAIGNFIRDAIAGGPIKINGDGLPVRSYMYAADAAVWLIKILAAGQAGEAYNVGSDQAYTLTEIANTAAAVINPQVKVNILGKEHAGFRSRYIPNIGKSKSLGLEIWTDIKTTIARTAEWHAANRNNTPTGWQTEVGIQEGKGERVKGYTFVVDIDGVLASLSANNDYALATPLLHTIKMVNSLYERGHRIILFTARGYVTGIDWSEITAGQMKEWGVKYHELRFGKPAGDYYIDDRLISIGELEGLVSQLSGD